MVIREAQINAFTLSLGNGDMPGVIYDTAVIGALKDKVNEPYFPDQVKAVLNQQNNEGYWGSDYFQPFDRLLNTASALYMITELGMHKQENYALTAFEEGVRYLEENHAQLLKSDLATPAAFEFLYPFFLMEIMEKTNKLTLSISALERTREKKLGLIGQILYKEPTPLLHSMEGIVSDKESAQSLVKFQEKNGSLAASPASTTVFIKYNVKEAKARAFRYIQSTIKSNGLAKHFDDYMYMNIAFSLYPLLKAGYKFSYEVMLPTSRLMEQWTLYGVPFGKAFPIADADDTAVSIVVLSYIGDPQVDERIKALFQYETEDHFLTYPFELSPSIMTNMHVLDALLLSPEYNASEHVFKVLEFIKSQTHHEHYLKGNKYNASSIIQTSNVVLTLLPYLKENAINYSLWLMKQFRWDEGLWGSGNKGSIEESAHALLALSWASNHGIDIDEELLEKAYSTLVLKTENGNKCQSMDLWTAKVQYSPLEINRAHLLASLFLYEHLNHKKHVHSLKEIRKKN